MRLGGIDCCCCSFVFTVKVLYSWLCFYFWKLLKLEACPGKINISFLLNCLPASEFAQLVFCVLSFLSVVLSCIGGVVVDWGCQVVRFGPSQSCICACVSVSGCSAHCHCYSLAESMCVCVSV